MIVDVTSEVKVCVLPPLTCVDVRGHTVVYIVVWSVTVVPAGALELPTAATEELAGETRLLDVLVVGAYEYETLDSPRVVGTVVAAVWVCVT